MSIQKPGAESSRYFAIERAVEARGRQGGTAKEIYASADHGCTSKEFDAALAHLKSIGSVVDRGGRIYDIRYTDRVAGRVQLTKSRDGLIRCGAAGEAGYLVKRPDLNGARSGDTVLVRPTKSRRGSVGGRLPGAVVLEILNRGAREVVGRFRLAHHSRQFVPFDPRVDLELQVVGADEVPDDCYVVVEVDYAASPRTGRVVGKIVKTLGPVAEAGVDTTVVLTHFGIPDQFPHDVLAAAATFRAHPESEEISSREDLRSLLTVTIDGESARDFDDALSIERDSNGGFRLGVHIADVSHYVVNGGRLDDEAFRRGTSVYFPDRAVPMLPESLSNGLCSLLPDVDRLTLSAFLEFDSKGKVIGSRFAETVIRSNCRLTYGEAAEMIRVAPHHSVGSKASPDSNGGLHPESLTRMLRDAERLMQLLRQRRQSLGALDFDLPAGELILDENMQTKGIRPAERTIAHGIVEEFMIAANEAAAHELVRNETPTLHRVHEPPRAASIEKLRILLQPFGLVLPEDPTLLDPRSLRKVLLSVEGKPEEGLIGTLVLRSLSRAIYEPRSKGHFALSKNFYTHFTSPIRRYPDLLVHRQLKSLWQKKSPDDRSEDPEDLEARLPGIGQHCSSTERRAEMAERELKQWKMVRFLGDRVGEAFAGEVTGVHRSGLFVYLKGYFVDGFVPLRALGDDVFRLDEQLQALVGERGGKSYRLGDALAVRLVELNERRRSLELRLVRVQSAKRRPGRNRRRGPSL